MHKDQELFRRFAGHALANVARQNEGDPHLAGFFDNLFGKKPGAQYESKPYLSFGATGDDVKIVQAKLGSAQTGQFDFNLESKVKAFQTSKGIAPSGTVDDRTWAAILGERYKDQAANAAATASTISTVGSTVTGFLNQFLTPPSNSQDLMVDPGTTTVAPAAPMSTLTYVAIGGGVLLVLGVGGYAAYRMTR